MTILLLLVKATVAAALALLFAWLARRGRASVRHVGLAAGFCVLLMLPLALPLVTWRGFEIPVSVSEAATAQGSAALPPLDDDAFDLVSSMVPGTAVQIDGRVRRGATQYAPLILIWALGVIVSVSPVVAGLFQMRRYRRFGVPMRREQAMLRELATAAGIARPVALLLHESIAGPLTFGALRPVVFLPRDSKTWERQALRRALVHEVEHVRRADWLVHCGSRIVCALYWFHPLVWMMWRQLALEAERACDDAVLGDAEATQYADQLVDLAERLSLEERRPLLAMAGRDELRTRVAAVLDPTLPRGRAGLVGLAVALVAALFLAGVAPVRAVALPLPGVPGVLASPEPTLRPIAPPVMALAVPRSAAAETPAAPPQGAPAPAVRPAFAVASVKINRSGARAAGAPPIAGGRFVRTNIPIDVLIATAYAPLQRFEIDGIPDWATMTRVDIEAVAEGPSAGGVAPGGGTLPQINLMLQSLLAERFKLAVHRETRTQSVYALVPARAGQLGPQLKAHTDDTGCVDPVTASQRTARIDPGQPLPAPPCGAWSGAPALGRLAGQAVSLDTFGRALSGQLGRMVLDRSGLAGLFDLTLEWTPLQQLQGLDPNAGAGATIGTPDRPSIFTAVQEQLGLKLDPQTGPVSVLVVDHVELPSEN